MWIRTGFSSANSPRPFHRTPLRRTLPLQTHSTRKHLPFLYTPKLPVLSMWLLQSRCGLLSNYRFCLVLIPELFTYFLVSKFILFRLLSCRSQQLRRGITYGILVQVSIFSYCRFHWHFQTVTFAMQHVFRPLCNPY